MSRRARRRRERDLLPNAPLFDRVLLRPAELALPDRGSLLDAIAERIQPSWPGDVASVTGSSSSAPRSTEGAHKPAISSPVVPVGDDAPASTKLRVCVERSQRTEVLHALGKTGAGSRSLQRPRKPASRIKC